MWSALHRVAAVLVPVPVLIPVVVIGSTERLLDRHGGGGLGRREAEPRVRGTGAEPRDDDGDRLRAGELLAEDR